MRMSEHKAILRSVGRPRGDGLDAEALQQSVIDGDNEQLRMGVDYPDEHVRLATVHTRQDLVLVVSYLASLNRRAKYIQWLLAAVVIMLLWRSF
jgi:hypothetical protein